MSGPIVCTCGHVHQQHEIRAGGLFGCYLHGCLCIDFADREERMATDMAAWEAEHGTAPEGHAWSAEWIPDGVGGLTFRGAVLLPLEALRLT